MKRWGVVQTYFENLGFPYGHDVSFFVLMAIQQAWLLRLLAAGAKGSPNSILIQFLEKLNANSVFRKKLLTLYTIC